MMKTIGSVLRASREKQGLSLEDISKKTKIRTNFLHALEENEFAKLPSDVVARGFIQVYARELGLDQQSALALFRRDFAQKDTGEIVPQQYLSPIKKRKHLSSTHKILLMMLLGIAFIIISVFGYVSISRNTLPSLTITEPKDNQTVQSPVTVKGKTATDVVVFVNEKQVNLDQDGVFESSVEFDPGEHTITVEIRNRQGKTKLVQKTVNVVE